MFSRVLHNMDLPFMSLSQLIDVVVGTEVDFLEVTPNKKIEWIKDCKEILVLVLVLMYSTLLLLNVIVVILDKLFLIVYFFVVGVAGLFYYSFVYCEAYCG